MLARLEQEEQVQSAQVDRRGELLRLRLESATDTARIVALLYELGFAAEVHGEVDVSTWYGPQDVGELSREEAAVIAKRVVPPFAREHGIKSRDAELVEQEVAGALHVCFVRTTLGAASAHGVSNDSCGRAVEAAVRPRLGAERAVQLGRAVVADLASPGRTVI